MKNSDNFFGVIFSSSNLLRKMFYTEILIRSTFIQNILTPKNKQIFSVLLNLKIFSYFSESLKFLSKILLRKINKILLTELNFGVESKIVLIPKILRKLLSFSSYFDKLNGFDHYSYLEFNLWYIFRSGLLSYFEF